ncbi:MAG: Rne/Rng family ribonuclease [Gammaproteobacteria bacterium]
MKRMLVNATQEEELRVAMVDGQRLIDLDIETPAREQKKANIYKGRITRIEPSLEAAFVEYGSTRHGFLPLKEISSEYFIAGADTSGRVNIRDVLKEGQDIVVQVEKEERGNKGAALTTFLSLAGRFLVLMPNNPRAGGVSRRITGADRDEVRDALKEVEIPEGMGAIVRTAGVGRGNEELQWDLDYLLQVWEAVKTSAVQRPAPFLIYQESNTIIRALRDHFSNDVGEILIDGDTAFKEAQEFVERVMPHNQRKLKFYQDPVPLFTRFQIESQIESAFAHSVDLPSGGSVVIDHTEALVSIDINSARSTKGEDIEATALNTNLEAAEEIPRQLRLRDLGGLIVIDFIDMGPQKAQREVENRLRDAVKMDRARIQIGRISKFGLLEMSRQRLRPSLGESAHSICPRCLGRGTVRGVESLSLSILRLLGEEARKDRTSKIIAELPIDVATYLLNEKRDWLTTIEQREQVEMVIVPRSNLESPHYQLRRVRDDAATLPENAPVSYMLPESEAETSDVIERAIRNQPMAQKPAVGNIVPSTPAPTPTHRSAQSAGDARPERPGLIARLLAWFRTTGEESKTARSRSKADAGKDKRKSSGGDTKSDKRGGRGGQQSRSRDRNRSSRDKARGDGEARSASNRGRRKKGPRSGSQDKTQQANASDTDSKPGPNQNEAGPAAQGEDGKPRSRRGGRRRRRGGRKRNQNAAANSADGQQQSGAPAQDQGQNQPQNQAPKPAQKDASGDSGARQGAENRSGETQTDRNAETTGTARPAPAAQTRPPAPTHDAAGSEQKSAAQKPERQEQGAGKNGAADKDGAAAGLSARGSTAAAAKRSDAPGVDKAPAPTRQPESSTAQAKSQGLQDSSARRPDSRPQPPADSSKESPRPESVATSAPAAKPSPGSATAPRPGSGAATGPAPEQKQRPASPPAEYSGSAPARPAAPVPPTVSASAQTAPSPSPSARAATTATDASPATKSGPSAEQSSAPAARPSPPAQQASRPGPVTNPLPRAVGPVSNPAPSNTPPRPPGPVSNPRPSGAAGTRPAQPTPGVSSGQPPGQSSRQPSGEAKAENQGRSGKLPEPAAARQSKPAAERASPATKPESSAPGGGE